MPKVSIIMPVYNTVETYLRESIESILNQTFKDFEFIIINDGSTNNAEEVILSYKDDRIKYVKNEENLKLIRTLNKGFDLAKGEYIARMDSDDISLPQRLEKQVDFLEKHPEVDVLGTWFQCFPRERKMETFVDNRSIKECLLINSNNIGHPTVMLRKSTVDKLNIRYDEEAVYVEDYALWLSLIDKVKLANLPEILLNYRIHSENVCNRNTLEQSLNCQKIMVIAQGNYFGIENKEVLSAIEKLKKGQEIKSQELLAINDFAQQVQIKKNEHNFSCDYSLDKVFYKFALKRCKKDLMFLNLLWSAKINKILRINVFFKLFNSFISFPFFKNKIPKRISKTPKVSAVMALYNTPYEYLEKTVQSVLNQTFEDFELIVIDDASSLEYKKLFEKFKDERIKYFKLTENSGPGKARNEGIARATGEYIAIIDSDDIYKPKRFEYQVEFLDKNKDVSLLSGGFQFSNNKKKSIVLEKDKDIKAFMLFNSALTNAAAMFRRKVFIKNELFYPEKLNFGEDYSLWLDAMFKGIKMANIKGVFMIYVRRKNQLSKTKIHNQISILKDLYKKIFLNLGFEASEEELSLHYDIYTEKFKEIKSAEQISNWFDKIIEYNKKSEIFDEKKLIDKKGQVLEKYNKVKGRLFKIKIGSYNLCLSKNLKIYLEERN